MDLAEWSGVLGIICRNVSMRILGGLDLRPTIVKNRASAADRVDGAPSERDRLGGGLLAHNIGEERRGGGRNGGHFGGLCVERGVDGVRGRAIGTIGGGDRARTVPVMATGCSVD
jgi:hypothetical protein